ncbi:hypothetical protein F5148DRAFT_1348509 [Russula earlei]|uniref:Uncharacterized protein n=1 Tax=Russula earlei TaxID=71964 RepID=A0ACC0UCC5_9AGAM|nr:hypothetical protein F5148DRAFT_1348509 [Russula earlei]
MIDKSQGFNEVPPPPYQHTLGGSSVDSKVDAGSKIHSTSSSRSSSQTTLSKRHPRARTKATTSSRWFPTSIFGLSKTAKQVRSATQGFIRDLLSQARPNEHEWHSVLGNCAETCRAQGLSFSGILQEPFVEGHLPIYWAILKRPPVPIKADHTTPPGDPDDLRLRHPRLLPPAQPPERRGCPPGRYEAFSIRSGTDRLLLGGTDAVDTVTVEETRGHAGGGPAAAAAFTVHFSITQFQLRMRVSKLARIEFIARGRLWYLAFSVAGVQVQPALNIGEWLVSLGLSEYSLPSWVDGHLSIVDHASPPSLPTSLDSSSVARRMALRGLPIPPKHPNSDKHRPAASLPIKTGNYQISPGGPMREVVVSLEKFLFGTTLQNDVSSFVDENGTLNGELEVKLQKTQELDSNCVIC